MKKLSLVIRGCLVLSIIIQPSLIHHSQAISSKFSDIRSGSDLETMVDYLSGKNIINGYPDGTFQPDRTINRAEALKIIFETVKAEADNDTDSGFSDVDPKQWFAKYVTSAKKKAIIKGYADGSFKPGQEVNRAEFIKMAMTALPFFNTMPISPGEAASQFSDIDTSQWYVAYVNRGLAMKFIRRTDRLRPTAPMQRQDAAEIVYEVSKYIDKNPSSLNTKTLYVPEESFVISNPTKTKLKDYLDYQFGPDKLTVSFDGKKTFIANRYHGYNITFNEQVRATGGTSTDDTNLFIDFEDGCSVEIYKVENQTKEKYYKEAIDPEDMMTPYQSTKLTKMSKYTHINVYDISLVFDQPIGEVHEYFIEKDKNTQFKVGPRRLNCDEKVFLTIENFEFR